MCWGEPLDIERTLCPCPKYTIFRKIKATINRPLTVGYAVTGVTAQTGASHPTIQSDQQENKHNA